MKMKHVIQLILNQCVLLVCAVTVNKNFSVIAKSWQDQRRYTYVAIEALGSHSVKADIQHELERISSQWPDLDGERPVSFYY